MIWFISLILLIVLYFLFMSPWSQIFGKYPYKISTKNKVIAITFDDGPNEPYTSELLEFLKQEGVVGTFFVVGDCLTRHPGFGKKIVKNGHVIGNHSQSHNFWTYFKPGAFKQEVLRTQESISKSIGKIPKLIRTPWLWRNPVLLNSLNKIKLHPIGGVFCHTLEVFGANAQTIANGAINKTKPGSIIIFHDGKEGSGGDRSQTIKAIKIYVKHMKNLGYQFVTVDKLLGLKAYDD